MARARKSGKKHQMTISFTEFDGDVFDYLEECKNASALIRHLVRAHIHQEGAFANGAIPNKRVDVQEDVKVEALKTNERTRLVKPQIDAEKAGKIKNMGF